METCSRCIKWYKFFIRVHKVSLFNLFTTFSTKTPPFDPNLSQSRQNRHLIWVSKIHTHFYTRQGQMQFVHVDFFNNSLISSASNPIASCGACASQTPMGCRCHRWFGHPPGVKRGHAVYVLVCASAGVEIYRSVPVDTLQTSCDSPARRCLDGPARPGRVHLPRRS